MTALTKKIRDTYRLIRERGDDGTWLGLIPEEETLARAAELEGRALPLWGMTFAVKDNIDVAGLPTTAGCPEFSYQPTQSAFVVQRLTEAGAIVIGKTNLDQFATGLNGTRTPHAIPRNSVNSKYISGGSSSGSAIAVARGAVDFALGTDTAGSGRIPAAFNNLVGYKPSKGRWSTSGLVPACRSLDCMTVLTHSVAVALAIDRVVAGFDAADPFSRQKPDSYVATKKCIGVLREDQCEFFGDAEYARLYDAAVGRCVTAGWEIETFDYAPFLEAASLLYQGPWLAERRAALRDFMTQNPGAMHPVVNEIVAGANRFSAEETFLAAYKLAEIIRRASPTWERCDAIMLPTAGTIYTVDEMLADPMRLNSRLGHYTNFVNLMDLCAIAVPAGFRSDGLPFGVSFIGPAWTEDIQSQLAATFVQEAWNPYDVPGIHLAVVGAHLRGQPLHNQLLALGAVFCEQTKTAPLYRLYALPNTTPAKPGLVRAPAGHAIEVEVYTLSEAAFGRFVAAIPAPLTIGSITLASGKMVKGFLCESVAVQDAQEISHLGGWRAFAAAE